MVYAIIGLNSLVFLFELGMSRDELFTLFHLYGVVPARFSDPQWAEWVGFPGGGLLSLFTHMFLHSGWMHFLGNMWVLWIFADNVEDVMGPFRFLFFYFLSGFAALGAHFFTNMGSTMPVVGASGAIAGVMGAYLLLYPHAKVVTFIPIFFIPYFIELPAVIFLGIWFFSQVSSGLFVQAGGQGAGVAWWAHAGGFIAGMIMLPVFRNKERCHRCFNWVKYRE